MSLPPEEGFLLLDHAVGERDKENAWLLYCSVLPHMTKHIPFSKFCAGQTSTPPDTRSAEEIIAVAERVKAADQQR